MMCYQEEQLANQDVEEEEKFVEERKLLQDAEIQDESLGIRERHSDELSGHGRRGAHQENIADPHQANQYRVAPDPIDSEEDQPAQVLLDFVGEE